MYSTHSNVHVPAIPANGTAGRNAPRPSRYPSRGFGSGYGNSSGYAAARSYTQGRQPVARFRLV